MNNICYHGTTNKLNITNKILPPLYSGILREDFRKKYLDKVFFTKFLPQAKKFAYKAANKYGGDPVIYIVVPQGIINYLKDGEYICDYAIIVNKIFI